MGTFRDTFHLQHVLAVENMRTVLGNCTAFTPQTDPHKRVLDSNIGTKKTARKWVSQVQHVAH